MRLSIKQKKILKLLSINCRFTNKDIAKAVGVSEDTIKYQIDKLVNKEKLGFFNTQFVHINLGYKSYHHWIRIPHTVHPEILKKIPHVNSINSSYGKFNYQLLSYAKNKTQLSETITSIKKLCPAEYNYSELVGQIKRYTNIIPSINIPITKPINKKKFEYEFSEEQYAPPEEGIKTKLDNIDKEIIKVLLKNPRSSFQEISNKTKINHETIRYRMKKYINERLINNFGLIHNYKKYNLFNSYILLKFDCDNQKMKDYLNKNPNIYFCPKLKGDYNAIIYILSENPTELGKIFDEVIGLIGSGAKKVDLIFWGDIIKYIQFPEGELDT